MKHSIMLIQVFQPLVPLQICKGLTWLYTKVIGKLTDECHCETNHISIFSCHSLPFWFDGAKIINIIQMSEQIILKIVKKGNHSQK